jgi:hypothetical protein
MMNLSWKGAAGRLKTQNKRIYKRRFMYIIVVS